jgi:hypothetical protein
MDPQAGGKNRGFAFVQYETVESCEMVCRQQYHTVDGHQVEVKRAVLKPPGSSSETPGINPGTNQQYSPYFFPYYGYTMPYSYDQHYYNMCNDGSWYPDVSNENSMKIQDVTEKNIERTSPEKKKVQPEHEPKTKFDENNNEVNSENNEQQDHADQTEQVEELDVNQQ